MTGFCERRDGRIFLNIRLTPKSSRNAVLGLMEGADGRQMLKIAVNALPKDGEANEELIRFLSKTLKCPKNTISLISGHSAREKRLTIASADETLFAAVTALGKPVAGKNP